MAGLFALLLVLAALRPLILPDEGRYGEVGRWMAVSGDWLVPRLNGLPFFHKPPLLYWLEAASVTLFGATPWALRLVPALHAAMMLAGLFLAARAWGGERLARRAALMLGCSPTFLLGGQYINHDMMVATWIGVAIWCFAAAFLHGDKPHTGWALAGFAACALGVLSKALIGIVLPGVVLFIWLLWTHQFRKVWRLPWLRGLLLFAVIAVPWFVLVERRIPGVFAYLFGVQQFTRYVGKNFNNVQPWWFYLPCMALLLFTWVWFALYEGWCALRRHPGRVTPSPAESVRREALSLCWIWIGAILVFFSIPSSKLLGYILPVMPPLALLAAVGWERLMAGRRAARAWFATLAALTLAVLCIISLAVGRYLDNHASSRRVAEALACVAKPGDTVYTLGRYPYDLPFYARLTQPLIVVQDWARERATAGDGWQRELFEAGDFDPAVAARVLQSPPAALAAARAAPNAWMVAPPDMAPDDFRPVARSGRWTLYASPAMSPRTCQHR
jgi:4-amino-4-deoxy-L-arabinose transferase-like glycosyltransferase